jgi:hypothetical protein
MRIISKFRDYYDSALGYGIDHTLVYLRKEKELELDKLKYKDYPNISNHRWEDSYGLTIIGFCGKIIPIIKAVKVIKAKSIYELDKTEDIFFYGDNALEELFKYQQKDDYVQPAQRKWQTNHSDWGMDGERKQFAKIQSLGLEELFIEHNVPIFKIEYGEYNGIKKLTLNPCLKDYKFFKLFDSYQAFQEISMFLGGVLPRKEPDTVEVSEACKVHSKGFDSWTFRKKGSNSKKVAKTAKGKKCK